MKKTLTALLCFLAFSAQADELQNRALAGQAGDVVTTAIALTMVEGLAEGNPWGVAGLVGKAAILTYANSLPQGPERDEWHRIMSVYGWGATVNNGCWILAVATGGGFGPACLPLGIATGVIDWHITADMVSSETENVYLGSK